MNKPGTTEAENDPMYQAGLLVAEAWGMLDDVLKGKVGKKQISSNLNNVRVALMAALKLLRELD